MATEYAFDINVSTDKQFVTLRVELPKREKARDPVLEFDDNGARELLQSRGFANYDLVRSAPRLTNFQNRDGTGAGVMAGEWVFENNAAPVEKAAAKKKTTAKKTTTKKTTTTS